jgi:valyl-tRNA synthetase
MNLDGPPDPDAAKAVTELPDRWILSRYDRTVRRVTESLDAYRFDDAARALYDFVWSEWCDWYLEMVKGRLSGEGRRPGESAGESEALRSRETARAVLVRVLEGTLRLLHPMMPFISEELWQQVPHRGEGRRRLNDSQDRSSPPRPGESAGVAEALIVAAWPEPDGAALDARAEEQMGLLREIVGAVRNIRGEMRVPPSRTVDLRIRTASPEIRETLEANRGIVSELARVETLTVGEDLPRPPESASVVLKDAEIYVPLRGVIDLDLERSRLKKDMDRLAGVIQGIDRKLANEGFVAKAPPEVVERERQKGKDCEASLTRLRENLKALMG